MKILFVDDDPHLLAGLRRLTRMSRGWTTFFAVGVAEALDLLEGTAVDAVVTDMRMPGRDGLELMEVLEERHPQLRRVVLTGYVDTARRCRAETLAHAWLNKPCSLDALRAALGDGDSQPASDAQP